jgi:hypothetical protein
MQRWTSDPLPVPRHPEAPYAEAELEFEDVEHDGPSFHVLFYLNNPEVTEDSGRDTKDGYAGELSVFAHGDCWGDLGHCEVPQEQATPFDRRPPHPLTPINLSVEITEALAALGEAEAVTVTALAFPVDPENTDEVLQFKPLTLVTYD